MFTILTVTFGSVALAAGFSSTQPLHDLGQVEPMTKIHEESPQARSV